jgi:uncharacterized protein (DUF58 family)
VIDVRAIVTRARSWRPSWSVFPTRRLAELILLTSVLWLVPSIVGRVLALSAIGAVLVAVAVDYVRLPSRRAISVEREAPQNVGLGDATTFIYRVRSTWRWPIRVSLADDMPSGIDGRVPSDAFVLGARESREVDADVIGQQRGRFSLGDIAVAITTSLGLLRRIVRVKPTDTVVVVPSLSNVRRFRLLSMQHRLGDVGVRALKQRGEGGAFAGLRDYVPGDDPRLLDWKSTARHGRLITREETVERSQTVISIIDCGRAMTQLAGRFPRFEHVLSAALVLGDVAASGGDRVGLLAFDDSIRAFVPPQRESVAVKKMRTALSALDATSTEPDYASAFRLLATRQRRRALLVFFTDVMDARTARTLVSYATRAAQRHVLILVAIQNEALLAAARPGHGGALALYRSAAAEELVREREEALARMRHAGISVLDVPPSRMAAAVINRYLEIKSRGAL